MHVHINIHDGWTDHSKIKITTIYHKMIFICLSFKCLVIIYLTGTDMPWSDINVGVTVERACYHPAAPFSKPVWGDLPLPLWNKSTGLSSGIFGSFHDLPTQVWGLFGLYVQSLLCSQGQPRTQSDSPASVSQALGLRAPPQPVYVAWLVRTPASLEKTLPCHRKQIWEIIIELWPPKTLKPSMVKNCHSLPVTFWLLLTTSIFLWISHSSSWFWCCSFLLIYPHPRPPNRLRIASASQRIYS